MAELPVAPVGRIISNSGAKRVGEDAREALAEYLEAHGEQISQAAVRLANHAGRKTVKGTDIDLAIAQIKAS